MTCNPCWPNAASVPPGPPSCTANRCRRASRRALPTSITATSHPAALRPKVVGEACCSRVRAAMRVDRCCSARAAAAADRRATSPRTRSITRRNTSISAVSSTSWLVAPKCTHLATSGGSCRRNSATRGMAGLAPRRPARPRAEGSMSMSWQPRTMAAAALVGTRPTSASAVARAASNSSMEATQARSEVASISSSVLNTGPNRPLAGSPGGKEHRLLVALQPNVEAVRGAVGWARCHQPAHERRSGQADEHRVGRIEVLFVAEVDAGHEPL